MNKTTIQINTVILSLITLILLNPTAYCLTESTSSTIQTIEVSFLSKTTYYRFSKQTNGHFLLVKSGSGNSTHASNSTNFITTTPDDIVTVETIKFSFHEKGELTGHATLTMDDVLLEGKYIHKRIEFPSVDGYIDSYGLLDLNGTGDDCIYLGFIYPANGVISQTDCVITIPEGHLLLISRNKLYNWIDPLLKLNKEGFTNIEEYREQEDFLDQYNSIKFYEYCHDTDTTNRLNPIECAFQDWWENNKGNKSGHIKVWGYEGSYWHTGGTNLHVTKGNITYYGFFKGEVVGYDNKNNMEFPVYITGDIYTWPTGINLYHSYLLINYDYRIVAINTKTYAIKIYHYQDDYPFPSNTKCSVDKHSRLIVKGQVLGKLDF